MDDAARLVVAAQRGDDRAFGALVSAYLPLLYNVVGRALGGHADVDDVVQETLLRVVRDLPALRDPGSFRPWLVAIAIRQISTYRNRRRRVPAAAEFDDFAQAGSDAQDLALMHLNLSGQRRQVVEAGRWLDPDFRILLSLWWQEVAGLLSRREVAQALGLSVAHAGVRLQRMREQLELSRLIAAALAAEPRCAELDAVLAGWDGQRTPLWRKRIGRHTRDCPVCTERAGGQIPLERLLVTFGVLPVPVGLGVALATNGWLSAAVGHGSLIGKLAQTMTAHPLATAATSAVLVAGPAVTYITWPQPVPRAPAVAAPPSIQPSPARTSARPSPARSSTPPKTVLNGMALGVWSMEWVSEPGEFLSIPVSGYAAVGPVGAASGQPTRQRATFTVVRGLADSRCYSFRAADGLYLRHYLMRLQVSPNEGTPLFREDATFCPRPGAVAGSVVFQSHNYPNHVLHPHGDGIYIEVPDGSKAFDRDSSFLRRSPWAG